MYSAAAMAAAEACGTPYIDIDALTRADLERLGSAAISQYYNPGDTHTVLAGADWVVGLIADELAKIAPAQVYNDGMTYYTVDVRHLATKDSGKAGEFGVVRNHSYVVNITDITGFGTPVYNGNTYFDPETPKNFETYVAADVRILSWRLVDEDYNIDTTK